MTATVVAGPLSGAPADRVVAAYLGNYIQRSERDPEKRLLPTDEPNALAALLLARLASRVKGDIARAVLRKLQAEAIPEPPPTDAVDRTFSERLIAWIHGAGANATDVLPALLSAGAAPAANPSAVAMAWRLLLLAMSDSAREPFDAERADLATRLARWLELQSERVRTKAPERDLQSLARTAYLVLEADARVAEDTAADAARDAIRALAELRARGQLETPDGAGAVPSSVLAQVLLAAQIADETRLAADVAADLEARLDRDRSLIRQHEDSEKFEFSPWVPLAIESRLTTTEQVEDVVDPQLAPLPGFAIKRVHGDRELTIEIDDDTGAPATRVVTARELNLLVDRILQTIATKETSARQHAHVAIALEELDRLEPAPATRATIRELIRQRVEAVHETQQANGGWFYGHKGVPSVVYAAGSHSATEFPDRQYTIDSAVPGVALCAAFARSGDVRHLDAARAVLSFFEDHIGRVERDGRRLWRLFPEDEKTERMGSAVNYELWAGYFFSWLLAVEDDEQTKVRLRSYLEDIVDYADHHLEANGDIAYGDYVDEKRTAYASWDAFLLHEIGSRARMPRAVEMWQRIVDRLAELLLPSGVLPNVADYFDEVDGHTRWLVHRHGIGPYPYRAYYQLYFAVAGSESAKAREAAARAFAFTLVHLHQPHTGSMVAGVNGRGEPDDRPGVSARDWMLLTLARITELTGMEYHPDIDDVDPPERRVEQMLNRVERRAAVLPQPDLSDVAAETKRLRSAQSDDGLISESGQATADAVTWLFQARPTVTETRLIDTVIRGAVKGLWTAVFDTRGRGFNDRVHQSPLDAAHQALAALAFRRAADELGMERLHVVADRALLHLLLAHRAIDGAPGSAAPDREQRALDDAKIHFALASQRKWLTPWLTRESGGAAADAVRF